MSNEQNSIVKVEDEDISASDLMIDWMALTEGLHDSWADWMPFLVFGMPYVQIAKIFDIDKSTITNALKFNPDFARRVAQGRKMVKRQLHFLWLDQKAVNAWKNIDYFLNIDPFEKSDDGEYVIEDKSMRRLMFTEKAKMSRFILQQLGLHVQRHEVLHHTPQPMFLGDVSLAEHVVTRVKEIVDGKDERDVEAIAAEFRVLQGDAEDAEFEELSPSEEEQDIERPYDRKSRVYPYEEV